MEVHNALILFRRSESYGFRYTTMIADGDNKVYHHIEKNSQDIPYSVEKFECANHLQKRAHGSLLKFGEK